MNTVAEIEAAIAQLTPEEWAEIRRWMDEHRPTPTSPAHRTHTPDFLARQEAIFRGRVVTDSQPVLDEMREERL